MLKKICRWIFGLCTFAGIMLIIGTAGASDCEMITFGQIIKQNVIALLLVVVGYFGLKLSGWEYLN